jgi:hypothetical protein
MPNTKGTKSFLAGAAREALLNALRATSEAKTSMGKVGPIGYIDPTKSHPPNYPSPCDVPWGGDLRNRVTTREIRKALAKIELQEKYLLKIYDQMCGNR